VEPDPAEHARYEDIYALYRKLYFSFGMPDSDPIACGDVLPSLKQFAASLH
jgi:L-ribulokinase